MISVIEAIKFQSEKMNQISKLVKSLIPIESSLNIYGPSGSGKTTWANYILEKSGLKDKFLTLDLKELDEESFSDLINKNQHRHLVLENIEFLHKDNQAHLFHYLQKSGFQIKPVIISTSKRSLSDLAQEGLLRQDLYYKLTVFKFELPMLKDIVEDIPVIAEYYLKQLSINYKKTNLKFTLEAINKLKMYFWAGNISELESVIERAILLTQDFEVNDKNIRFDEFQKHSSLDLSLGMSLSEVERRLILQTLEHTDNNRTKAAHILGISIRTLRNKLNEYKEAGLI